MIDRESDTKIELRLEVANLQAELDWLRQQLASSPDEEELNRQHIESRPKVVVPRTHNQASSQQQRDVQLTRAGKTRHITLPPPSKDQIDSLLARPSPAPATIPRNRRNFQLPRHQQLPPPRKAQPKQEKRRFGRPFQLQQPVKQKVSGPLGPHVFLHQIGSTSRALSKAPTRNRASLFSAIRQKLYHLRKTTLLEDETTRPLLRANKKRVNTVIQTNSPRVFQASNVIYYPSSRSRPMSPFRPGGSKQASGPTLARHAAPSRFPPNNMESSARLRRSDAGTQNRVANGNGTSSLPTTKVLEAHKTGSTHHQEERIIIPDHGDFPVKCTKTEIRLSIPAKDHQEQKEASGHLQSPTGSYGTTPKQARKDHRYLHVAIPTKECGMPIRHIKSPDPQDQEIQVNRINVNLQPKNTFSPPPESKFWAGRTFRPQAKAANPARKTTKMSNKEAFEKHGARIAQSHEGITVPQSRTTFKGNTNIRNIISIWDGTKPSNDIVNADVSPPRQGPDVCEEVCGGADCKTMDTVVAKSDFKNAVPNVKPRSFRMRDAREEIHEESPTIVNSTLSASSKKEEDGFKKTAILSKNSFLTQIRNAKHLKPLEPREKTGGTFVETKPKLKAPIHGPGDFLAGIKAGVKLRHVKNEQKGSTSSDNPTAGSLLAQIQARKKELRQLEDNNA